MTLNIVELRIAMEAGGLRDRGVVDVDGFEETIRSRMDQEGLPNERFSDIQTLAFAFVSFAQDVRAAALKKRPIVSYAGETLPRQE